jgi:hypothetical protein
LGAFFVQPATPVMALRPARARRQNARIALSYTRCRMMSYRAMGDSVQMRCAARRIFESEVPLAPDPVLNKRHKQAGFVIDVIERNYHDTLDAK